MAQRKTSSQSRAHARRVKQLTLELDETKGQLNQRDMELENLKNQLIERDNEIVKAKEELTTIENRTEQLTKDFESKKANYENELTNNQNQIYESAKTIENLQTSEKQYLKKLSNAKRIEGILLIAIIIAGASGGYFFYAHTQRINSIENNLAQANIQINDLQNTLDKTKNDLSQTQGMLDTAEDQLTRAEDQIRQLKAKELRNPTRKELREFLLQDTTNEEVNYLLPLGRLYQLVHKLKENAAKSNIRTAFVYVELEGRIGYGYRSEPYYEFLLGAELDTGEKVVFYIFDDELYDSPENLIEAAGTTITKVGLVKWYWD